MTTIQFYHLLSTPLTHALPKLMEKALQAGYRAVIVAGSDTQLAALDDALWTADAASFIPHGSDQDGAPEEQPIYLTLRHEAIDGTGVLVITDGSSCSQPGQYEKILDMFDGHDEAAVEAARTRWKAYREADYPLHYIQQQPGGGWKCMAKAND